MGGGGGRTKGSKRFIGGGDTPLAMETGTATKRTARLSSENFDILTNRTNQLENFPETE